ncbi:two-component system phosphate regulon response regulator OmpR [Breoghania corrubedonensis]|uniref:Two-component system phosphate regulon response regulator OmpR n=1 Tax=Breoghania corrubedonensis TaxID=665038 RepID=A0A2T5UNV9_9HYPH|nr:response regulator transcription factor [Breoghania corrubedonensis]PTW53200.1 two-component system phosphate regulon response regulator OmpR [Breoghania corrubedonensis]
MQAQNRSVPADDAAHLLIVDDDNRIRTLLSRFLAEHGYRVSLAASAAEARGRLRGLDFDLLILDVMMPGESGFDLAQAIRQSSQVPILMLTARSESDDRIHGLELGADDYLAKPFEPRELLLRINNILKRERSTDPEPLREIRFGPYVFQTDRMELKCGDELVRLTDREKQILTIFAERRGETVPRHMIVGGEIGKGERTADVQINRLRRKIETDPSNPLYLQTVRGIGYRLLID